MEVDRRGVVRSRVTAVPRPGYLQNGRRSQMFGLTSLAGQVLVDALSRRPGVSGKQISGHECNRVISCVLPGLETVIYAIDNVQSAQIGAAVRDPLALDNRMGWVLVVFLPGSAESEWRYRSIRQASGCPDSNGIGRRATPISACSAARYHHSGLLPFHREDIPLSRPRRSRHASGGDSRRGPIQL